MEQLLLRFRVVKSISEVFMFRISTCIVAAAFAAFGASAAQATPVSLSFPGAGGYVYNSTRPDLTGTLSGGDVVSIWNTGDYVDQTFTGVPLGDATSLSYSLSFFNYIQSGYSVGYDVLVNGVAVDSFVVSPGESGYSHAVSFASIAGNGTYELELLVTAGVPGGAGSAIIDSNGLFTLDGRAATAAPEPATLALFGAGLVGLGLKRRRGKG